MSRKDKRKTKKGKARLSVKKLFSSGQKKSLVTKILILINILIALILLLSYTSPYISPRMTTIPAFLGLAYPFLVLINLGFVLFWLILFKPYFFISTVALILGLNHLSAHFQIHRSVELQDAEVIAKVMSYNVRLFDLYPWKKNKESVKSILNAFVDHAPDILCVQEFYQNKNEKGNILKQIRSIHQLSNVHIKYWKENSNGGYGIATFSSLPIIKREEILLSETTPIYALVTDIVSKKDTMRVFNLHLSSYHFAKDDYNFVEGIKHNPDSKAIRTGSLKVLKKMSRGFNERAIQASRIREAIEASPYPVIVCGDFNDAPSGYAYNKVKGELRDAFMESGSGLGRSYTGIFPAFRIDYILHDPAYQSINFRMYPYTGSDHNPLVCYLIQPEKE